MRHALFHCATTTAQAQITLTEKDFYRARYELDLISSSIFASVEEGFGAGVDLGRKDWDEPCVSVDGHVEAGPGPDEVL